MRQLTRNIATFFKSALFKEIATFLVFLFISFLFWALQTLQDTDEFNVTIPVYYDKAPENLTIANKLPESFKVTLRDKGTMMYYYFRHKKNLTLRIDPMFWYKEGSTVKIPEGIIESLIRDKLRPSTQLLSVDPGSVSIIFTKKASKEVPVILNERVSFSPQYMQSGQPFVYPDKVTVYGPYSVIDKIKYVETETLNAYDLNDTVAYLVQLKPIKDVSFSPKKVKVTINVEEFTERTVSVPVTGLNFPPDEKLLSFPGEVKVSFFVGMSSYSRINPGDFIVAVAYDSLKTSNNKTHSPVVMKYPVTVRNVRVSPEKVECMIEKSK